MPTHSRSVPGRVHRRRPAEARCGHYVFAVAALLAILAYGLRSPSVSAAAESPGGSPATGLAGDVYVWGMKPTEFTTLVSALIAAVALGNVLYQAYRAQTWKRKEFVSAQMTAFVSDPAVQIATTILDYTARRLNLALRSDAPDLKSVYVDHKLVAAALAPHLFPDGRDGRSSFTEFEVALRDIFDVFLEKLDKIYVMIEAKLIKVSDVRPYLAYWIESIADTDRYLQNSLARSLWIYIQVYEFDGVQKLCRAMGHPIVPSQADLDRFAGEIALGDWSVSVLKSELLENITLGRQYLLRTEQSIEGLDLDQIAEAVRAIDHSALLEREVPMGRLLIEYLATKERALQAHLSVDERKVMKVEARLLRDHPLWTMAVESGVIPHAEDAAKGTSGPA